MIDSLLRASHIGQDCWFDSTNVTTTVIHTALVHYTVGVSIHHFFCICFPLHSRDSDYTDVRIPVRHYGEGSGMHAVLWCINRFIPVWHAYVVYQNFQSTAKHLGIYLAKKILSLIIIKFEGLINWKDHLPLSDLRWWYRVAYAHASFSFWQRKWTIR